MVQQTFAQINKQSHIQKPIASGILQRNSKSAILQRYADNSALGGFGSSALAAEPMRCEPKPNRTGMPDGLKAGLESLSGFDLSDVKVHANSDRPKHLNALAYTQGNEVYLGPGQEKHLPHEAWHVVQQAQGRVRPIMQMKGLGINDDPSLENEAGVMSTKAAQLNALNYPQGQEVYLEPGQEKEVTLHLNYRSFAYYDVPGKQWKTEPGNFALLVGGSSANIRLRTTISVD